MSLEIVNSASSSREKVTSHSPEIQAALDLSKDALANFTRRLDQVSFDVKKLEDTLKGYGICVPHLFKSESQGFFRLDRGDGEYLFEKAVFIGWLEHDDAFRLTYCEGEVECRRDKDGNIVPRHGNEHILIRSQTPLIETKAKTRLEVHRKLPDFVKDLSVTIEWIGEEIPF